jgi:WD40 repeat protein
MSKESVVRPHERIRLAAVLCLLTALTVASQVASSWHGQVERQRTPIPPPDPAGDALPKGAAAIIGSQKFRHGDSVTTMSMSPDGKLLATVSAGRPAGIRVWNLANGTTKSWFNNRVYQDAAFLPDNKTLAISTWEAGVFFVDLNTGKTTKHIATPNATERIALSPDGNVMAGFHIERDDKLPHPTGGKIVVTLFDVPSGKVLRRIERKHDQAIIERGMNEITLTETEMWNIKYLAFTGDGRSVAAGTWDKTVTLSEVASGEWVREAGGRKHPAYAFALSKDGKTLAAVGADGTLRGVDIARGTETFRIPLGLQLVKGLAFSPDSKFITVTGAVFEGGNWIEADTVWEIAGRKRVCRLPTFGTCVAFTPDGKTLCLADRQVIRLFDPATGKERQARPNLGHRGSVYGLAFSPDGRTLVSEGDDNRVLWWDLKTGKQVRQQQGNYSTYLSSLAFSADGRRFASRGNNNSICVRDAATGKEICNLRGHAGIVFSLALSPDGKTAVSAERDGPAIVWDVDKAKETARFSHPFKLGETVVLSADATRLAVVKQSFSAPNPGPHPAGIWDPATGKEIVSFQFVNTEAPAKIFFSRDKKLLIARAYSGIILIVDAATGKEIRRASERSLGYPADILAVSPDGTLVATTSELNSVIRVFDVKIGDEIRRIPEQKPAPKGAPAFVQPACCCLAFSTDSRLLAVGSADSTIVLWDVRGKRRR